MDRIFNIVGPSGSGKTTIAKELEKLGYNIIYSYTTREPREPNEWGHTFVDEEEINNIRTDVDSKLKIIVTRKGNTQRLLEAAAFKKLYNDYYFATKDQYQGKGTSIYIVDPDGAEQVKRNVKDAEVITIFLMADEEIREKRLKDRAYKNRGIPEHISIENYEEFQKAMQEIEEEIDNRLMKDIKIFSTCKCDYAVDANRSIEEVLADVKEIIGEEC